MKTQSTRGLEQIAKWIKTGNDFSGFTWRSFLWKRPQGTFKFLCASISNGVSIVLEACSVGNVPDSPLVWSHETANIEFFLPGPEGIGNRSFIAKIISQCTVWPIVPTERLLGISDHGLLHHIDEFASIIAILHFLSPYPFWNPSYFNAQVPHIYVDLSFSLSDLLHSLWQSLGVHISTNGTISFLFIAE